LRDPEDDKFLDVAANGGAVAIVTGDSDLLALGCFEGISIVTPAGHPARS
jgi:predicted nucleic acid-binding protein